MEQIRCGCCGAMLFKASALSGKIEIKCRKCRTLNVLRPISEAPTQSAYERPIPKDDQNGRE